MPNIQTETSLPLDEIINNINQLSSSEIEQLISCAIAVQARRKTHSLPEKESELLLKINQGLPSDIRKRLDELIAKRQTEALTPDEHTELVDLTEQIEKSDAERVKCLADLARLRGVTLTALMKELEIH